MSMRDRLAKKMSGFAPAVETRIADLDAPAPSAAPVVAADPAEPSPAPSTSDVPRTGVGRATYFSARIAELEAELAQARVSGALIEIPLDALDDNPEQIETVYDNDYIAQLADAWKAGSEPPPIEVRRSANQPGRFTILAGHHRARAAGLAQRVAIKARVIDATDDRATDLVFVSNHVKARPDWINAQFFARRMKDRAADGSPRFATQAALARYYGVHAGLLSYQLKMLDLPEPVRALLQEQPGLFSAVTAAEVILPAIAEHPDKVGKVVEAVARLKSGTPQSSLKGLLQQSLKATAGRPPAPTKTFGNKAKGFVRTVQARRVVIAAGPEVDLADFQKELDALLERWAERR